MSFQQALAFTLRSEGGYSDNPNDHGGVTNHGITQETYDRYRTRMHAPLRSVAYITDVEVRGCYQQLYWIPAHCDEMTAALGVCVFDWAVNHGVGGAIETLQDVLGIGTDGVFGPMTHQALLRQDDNALWREYNDARRTWYRAFVAADASQAGFLSGWLDRVTRLDMYAEKL